MSTAWRESVKNGQEWHKNPLKCFDNQKIDAIMAQKVNKLDKGRNIFPHKDTLRLIRV